jgi:hypothetical protein
MIKETPMESPFGKMSVTHDMSKSEREINKQKVLEAKAMNEQDKSGEIKYIRLQFLPYIYYNTSSGTSGEVTWKKFIST